MINIHELIYDDIVRVISIKKVMKVKSIISRSKIILEDDDGNSLETDIYDIGRIRLCSKLLTENLGFDKYVDDEYLGLVIYSRVINGKRVRLINNIPSKSYKYDCQFNIKIIHYINQLQHELHDSGLIMNYEQFIKLRVMAV